jgi:hypothetical protein
MGGVHSAALTDGNRLLLFSYYSDSQNNVLKNSPYMVAMGAVPTPMPCMKTGEIIKE